MVLHSFLLDPNTFFAPVPLIKLPFVSVHLVIYLIPYQTVWQNWRQVDLPPNKTPPIFNSLLHKNDFIPNFLIWKWDEKGLKEIEPILMAVNSEKISWCLPNYWRKLIHSTVKLDNKERFDKEQICIKELFTDYQPFYTISLLLDKNFCQ